MSIAPALKKVLDKYRTHPQFLGLVFVDPNQRGAVDDMPLHIAARRGDDDDIKILVAHGADVNATGDLGSTALHYAASRGRKTTVQILLSLGARTDIRNEY